MTFTRRPSALITKALSITAVALVAASCGTTRGPAENPEESTVPAPDGASGFDDIVTQCKSADSPPQATIEDTRAWAKEDPVILCVDELKNGEFVAFNLTEQELGETQLKALTPGEEVSDDSVIPDPDTPARFVLNDNVYDARYFYYDTDEWTNGGDPAEEPK